MDKDLLVTEGQKLIAALDGTRIAPRGAMWVYSSDSDSWKLWIIPAAGITNKEEFYRLVSQAIEQDHSDMPSLNVGLIEMKSAEHPAIKGLSGMLRMEGIGAATFANNRLNGFFLPDGVVLRMAI